MRQKNHLYKELVDEEAKCRMTDFVHQARNCGLKMCYMKRRAKSYKACKDRKMKEKPAKDENRHALSSYELGNISHSRWGKLRQR
jgi:hypothetical protein